MALASHVIDLAIKKSVIPLLQDFSPSELCRWRMMMTANQSNYAKQSRYALCHEHLDRALKHGFYIEASVICESMISDRLHSNLHWRVTERKHFSMNQLIQRLKQTPAYESNPPRISLSSATLSILIDVLAFNGSCSFEPKRKDPLKMEL